MVCAVKYICTQNLGSGLAYIPHKVDSIKSKTAMSNDP
jgi:hypothetical protein